MVSAESLNLDVLELVFAYLLGNDLPSVALVSRSFLAAVIPRLYRSISYRYRQAKGYESGVLMSPFAVLVSRQHLAIHARRIEIRAIPIYKQKLHPKFLREASQALQLCTNLQYFKCTVRDALPLFLRSLEDKQLKDLRIAAALTTSQAGMLPKHAKLSDLVLQFASWNVVDILPLWSEKLTNSLTTLTLFMINELTEGILISMLKKLPSLVGLHVVGCPKTDHIIVLNALHHTPRLESLSFSASESPKTPTLPAAPLVSLKRFSLDSRYGISASATPRTLSTVLTHLWASNAPVSSFTFKLPDRKMNLGDAFLNQFIKSYSKTLRRLSLMDCAVSVQSIVDICKSCKHLERLELAFPVKELIPFGRALASSKSLTTLVDIENHVEHGIRHSLGLDNAKYLMISCPTLKKIVYIDRIWTGRLNPGQSIADLQVVSEKRHHSHSYGSLWFMPPRSDF